MKTSNQPRTSEVAIGQQLLLNSRRLVLLVVFLLACGSLPTLAQEQDNQYLRVHEMIQEADSLNGSGKTNAALAKYREAHGALQKIRATYPDWNTKVVSFRTKYLAEKINTLTQNLAAANEPSAPAGAANQPTNSGSKAPSTTVTAPKVKLLEPGAEPRKALRLHAKAGDKQNITLTTKMSMDMQMGEAPGQAMKMPTTKMPFEFNVTEVGADGEITHDIVIGEVTVVEEEGVLPQVTEAIKTSYSGLKGQKAKGKISARGIRKPTVLNQAAADPMVQQALDQFKEMLSNLAIVFPEEAIGPGGKWEVQTAIKTQGMVLDQVTTYELVSVDGDLLTLKATGVQRAANQKIQNPMMPGMKMDLKKMDGKATSDMKFNLSQVMANDGNGTAKADFTMAMNMGGQDQVMTMKTDVNVRIESK
jgi:hypothetical protein